MFNLKQAIADWRQQMRAAGINAPDVLDELEAHLREDIERQVLSGVSEEQACAAAIARMGEAPALEAEFAKTIQASVGSRKSLRVFYFIAILFLLLVNTWTLLEFEISLGEKFAGFCAVALIALYLARLPHLLKSLPEAAYARLVKLIKVAASLVWLWSVWALLHATHTVNWDFGIVITMVLWCLCAAIGLSALAYGLNERNRLSSDSGDRPPPFQPNPQPIPPTRPSPPDFGIPLPPAHQFAPLAREALAAAAEEASRLGHDFIGTEHVLLGVLKLAKGGFEHLLRKLHLDRETVRQEIERAVSAVPPHAGWAMVPLTPRARKALQFAAHEAKGLNQPCISLEHIFLGLLLEGGGVAGQVLRKLGIRSGRTRAELLSQLRERPTASS